MSLYFMTYKNGNYVAIDRGSGGYDYQVTDIFNAAVFHSITEAMKYRQTMKADWTIHEFVRVESRIIDTEYLVCPCCGRVEKQA